MTVIRGTLIAVSLVCLPAPGWAQGGRWTPEISAALGLAHVFRFDDETFGNRPNAGIAVAMVHRSGLVLELAADRVFDLQPKPGESESRDRGFGPDLDAGLRIVLSPHVALSPEVRWLDASLLSRENLAVTRVGVRMAYRW